VHYRIVMEQLVHDFNAPVIDAGDQPVHYFFVGAGFIHSVAPISGGS
jgi:hypothetical protein